MPARHIMLFDLYSDGHHLQYIQQLARYWVRHGPAGQLSIVVPRYFAAAHPWLADYAKGHRKEGVRLVPIEKPVHVQTPRRFDLVRKQLDHGRLLKQAVEKLQPDHALLLYFDHAQLPLAMRLRLNAPTVLSGIYFRPSFHYGGFEGDRPDARERVQRWQKRVLLAAALRHPRMHHLFCLDPYVIPHVQAMKADVEAVALPDGIEPPEAQRSPEAVRSEWEIEPGRRVALLFGALGARKGVFAVLDAVQRLPATAQQRLALVLAGRAATTERDAVHEAVRQAQHHARVQVVLDDRFLPDAALHDVLRSADLNLLTYQRHLGSSGVLIRSAAASVPVLASGYGLVGEHVRRRHLGLAVDTTDPTVIAEALARWLDDSTSIPFDPEEAARFGAANTAEAMAGTIYSRLGFPVPARAETIDE